jgi:hypothetical protein
MGREFAQEELEEESVALRNNAANGLGTVPGGSCVATIAGRAPSSAGGHHPHPSTHPMIVTTERDWRAWRVPSAEYDLDPCRIERQAEIIVRVPIFMKLLEQFVEYADREPGICART